MFTDIYNHLPILAKLQTHVGTINLLITHKTDKNITTFEMYDRFMEYEQLAKFSTGDDPSLTELISAQQQTQQEAQEEVRKETEPKCGVKQGHNGGDSSKLRMSSNVQGTSNVLRVANRRVTRRRKANSGSCGQSPEVYSVKVSSSIRTIPARCLCYGLLGSDRLELDCEIILRGYPPKVDMIIPLNTVDSLKLEPYKKAGNNAPLDSKVPLIREG